VVELFRLQLYFNWKTRQKYRSRNCNSK